MNQYNFVLFFVLVVRGSHSISDEVKVLGNPRIPEQQKRLKAGLSTTSQNQDKYKMKMKITNKKVQRYPLGCPVPQPVEAPKLTMPNWIHLGWCQFEIGRENKSTTTTTTSSKHITIKSTQTIQINQQKSTKRSHNNNSESTNNHKTQTSSNNHINKRTILNIENLCSSELWYWRLLPLSPWQVPVPSGPWPLTKLMMLMMVVLYTLHTFLMWWWFFIGPGRIGLSRGWYRHSSCDISRCW